MMQRPSTALKKRDKDQETVLMVVGAGRGPLVHASLQAGKRANRKLRVYAVEKNANAGNLFYSSPVLYRLFSHCVVT